MLALNLNKEGKQCGSDGIQDSQSLGIILQTNTPLSPESLVSGGNRQRLMEPCLRFPSLLLQAPRGTEKGTGNKLKEDSERAASRRKERERDSTRWIMQSCQRRLLLEVLAVLKRASPDLHKLHQPLSPLPVAESCLICAPANRQQRHAGGEGQWPGHSVAGELSWRDTPMRTSTLFITIIYRGQGQEDLSGYVKPPSGNTITGQKAWWIVAVSAALTTRILQNALCAKVTSISQLDFGCYTLIIFAFIRSLFGSYSISVSENSGFRGSDKRTFVQRLLYKPFSSVLIIFIKHILHFFSFFRWLDCGW